MVYFSGNCDDDWTEYDGYCYYVSHSKTTWNDAEVQCQQKMATLASIRNKKDNHFLTTITYVLTVTSTNTLFTLHSDISLPR